jgi:hypothetical protein
MGMFEATGRREAGTKRKENTLRKLARMKTALSHREPDRVLEGTLQAVGKGHCGALSSKRVDGDLARVRKGCHE